MDDEGVRYALVPSGFTACEMCLMQASKGFAFEKEFNPHENKNHNCTCKFVPGIQGKTKVDGYDDRAYYERWKAVRAIKAAARASDDDLKLLFDEIPVDDLLDVNADILAMNLEKCRETCDAKTFAAVVEEAKTRWPAWLYRGSSSEIRYETPQLEDEIKSKRPHEFETAKRMAEFGLKTDFRIDELNIGGVTVPFSDFVDGTEIKTPSKAVSQSTFDRHIRESNKKKETTRLLFDISDNDSINVETAALFISNSRLFKGSVYVLDKDELKKIY